MHPLCACAALAAVPVLVSPALCDESEFTPTQKLFIASVQILVRATEVLNSDMSSSAKADEINELADLLKQAADAKQYVDQEEWDALDKAAAENDAMKEIFKKLTETFETCIESGCEGSSKLQKAIIRFGQAVQKM